MVNPCDRSIIWGVAQFIQACAEELAKSADIDICTTYWYISLPKTPNIPVFLRQAGNTYHKYFNGIHKDDITKTIFFNEIHKYSTDFNEIHKDDGSEE